MLTALVVLLRSIGLICGGHRAVALENLALRQQVAVLRRTVKRPRLRTRDRLFWILLAQAWRDWRTALLVVRPDTVVRWHRQWLRRRWTWRSTRTRPGRPSTDAAIRALVGTMAAANPLWGAPRIHGELCKLGLTVSERTVSRLLRRPRRPSSQTWRTFLTNHVATLVSMDFFTVPTLTGRVLFVFVLLAHQRRRIVHFNITEHPTAAWTAQQMIEAFPDDTAVIRNLHARMHCWAGHAASRARRYSWCSRPRIGVAITRAPSGRRCPGQHELVLFGQRIWNPGGQARS